jgi:RHS repeat-associated protein
MYFYTMQKRTTYYYIVFFALVFLFSKKTLCSTTPTIKERSTTEFANHLGNVLTVLSDRKLQHSSDNIYVDYYTAHVLSSSDYYAFGGKLNLRGAQGDYRYNFNGKEFDDETGTQDYGMRIYNPGIGKFLSVDPLAPDYPELTPYQFASNSPISNIDVDGLESAGAIVPAPDGSRVPVPTNPDATPWFMPGSNSGPGTTPDGPGKYSPPTERPPTAIEPEVNPGGAILWGIGRVATLIVSLVTWDNGCCRGSTNVHLDFSKFNLNPSLSPKPQLQNPSSDPGVSTDSNTDTQEKKRTKTYTLYLTQRSIKGTMGVAASGLPYFGITSITPVGTSNSRYHSGSEQGRNLIVLGMGLTYEQAKGAEQALIELNNNNKPNPAASTRIDNLINSTDPARVDVYNRRQILGTLWLDTFLPNWRTEQLYPETEPKPQPQPEPQPEVQTTDISPTTGG